MKQAPPSTANSDRKSYLKFFIFYFTFIIISFFPPLGGQRGVAQITVSTHAGTGIEGFVDGDALTQAQFSFPIGVGTCIGNDGALYVADRGNHAVRKIFNGQVTTLAGNGTQGYADGVGSAAQFAFPNALTVDDTNNVYVADWLNSLIRKITPSGVVTTYAGTPGQNGYQDGPGSTALFFAPFGLTIDTAGNIYVADANEVIRKIAPDRTVSTYAGQYVFGQGGYLDGPASIARFNRPSGLDFDNAGNLYVAEESNHTIRKISASLLVTTIAGVNHIGAGPGSGGYVDGNGLTTAEFNTPTGIVVDNAGNIYVADESNHRIRKIDSQGNVTTFAGSGPVGSGNGGFADGPANSARFNLPYGICHDNNNNLYVADINNHRIRKISYAPLICNLQTSFIVTDETCIGAEDGAIALTITNGTPPFTYQWSNGATTEDISNLPTGGYFVIVTDSNNCTATGTTVVNTIPPDSATAANTPPACSELFISEYEEGTGQNKALEIYNPTNDTILLNRYLVRVFMNGAPTPLLTQLIGYLQPHKTHVITHPNASSVIQSKAQQTSQKLNFDGDDALQLIKINNDISINIDSIEGIGQNPHTLLDSLDLDTIDQLGIPYVDPGNQGFSVGSGTTKNSTLIRNFSVTSGLPDWECGQKQWRVSSVNSYSDLGKHSNYCKISGTEVKYSFQNPSLNTDSATGNKYLEFDIYVSSNVDTTYFFNTNMFIQYDTLTFGTMILPSKVNMQRVYPFDDTTYTEQGSTIFNYNANTFGFYIVANNTVTPWNLVKLTPSPIPLFHFTIRVDSCNKKTGLKFINPYGPVQTGYSLAPDTIVGYWSYSSEIFENELDLVLCELNIHDFYPNPITAGTNSILTITGIGFGNTRGIGQVWFADADTGGFAFIKHLDYIDYVSWKDNEIKVIVPSYVDTLYDPGEGPTAGSGQIRVEANNGQFKYSNDALYITYSIINVKIGTPPKQKLRVDLVDPNPTDLDSGYVFLVDTSISNHPAIQMLAEQAIHDWACITGIRMKISGSTTKNKSQQDGVSLIFMDTSQHGNKFLGQTAHWSFGICLDQVTGDTIVVAKEMDIAFAVDIADKGKLWKIDTTFYFQDIKANEKDLYEVMQHELGHAHSLGHVEDYDELMYFAAKNGPLSPAQRRMIFYSTPAQDGAKDVMNRSESLSPGSACNSLVMLPLFPAFSVCGTSAVKELFLKWNTIFVYPNPASQDYIFVEYSLYRTANVHFGIYDLMGRVIISVNFNKQPAGRFSLPVKVSTLASGMYFLNVTIDGLTKSIKLIKP